MAIPEGLIKTSGRDTLFFHHGIVAVTVMDGQEDIQSDYLVSKKEDCIGSRERPLAHDTP